MGRHTDPAAVTRRATVLTLTVSALLVAGGIAILKSSGGTGSPEHPPTATATLPPSIDESPSPEPTPTTSAALPTPTATPPRAEVNPVGATTTSPRSTPRSTVAAPATAALASKATRTGPRDARLSRQVVTLVNVERAKAGCGPVTTNAALQRAAQAHSAEMAANDFLSHIGLDGSTMAGRIRDAGYRGEILAENIAAGPVTARAVMKSWMASARHRAIILDCRLTAIGVGHASGGSLGSYWTQDFGG